jgi:serpin B
MAYAGTRGQTAEQIAKVMHFDVPADKLGAESASLIGLFNGKGEDRGYQLAMANAMWGQRAFPFAPQFGALLSHDFGASLRTLDFAQPEPARLEINRWASDQTRGKIEDLIPQGGVTPATRLVLTNAVYFKAQWDHPFKSEATRPAPFKVPGAAARDVPMMHTVEKFHFVKGNGLSAVEMP